MQRPEWLRATNFDLFVEMEAVADRIRTYEPTLMPGICQTPEYARAVLSDTIHDEAEIDERVRLRMARRPALHRAGPRAQWWAVIDEAVLHRRPTDPAAMRGQLEQLLLVAEQPNITIQVIPFAAGPYATAGNGSFVIMESSQFGQVVYAETPAAATYFETSEAMDRYLRAWGSLADRALEPEDSAAMITAVLSRT